MVRNRFQPGIILDPELLRNIRIPIRSKDIFNTLNYNPRNPTKVNSPPSAEDRFKLSERALIAKSNRYFCRNS